MKRAGSPPSVHGLTGKTRTVSDSDTYSEALDPDDPQVTHITKDLLDDYEDERRNALRQINYRQRIEFNVTCESQLFKALLF